MHILMTANAAWNIVNFRMALVRAFLDAGHRVSVAAPLDDSAGTLRALGCRVLPLAMSPMGLNPLELALLRRRYLHLLQDETPDVVLSYTVKPNICGALAASALGIPFIPNVTGLGTAFLSGGLLQRLAVHLYRLAFPRLPVVFFQNPEDRALFRKERIVDFAQARLLPGSGIDLDHFAPAPERATDRPMTFLMVGRLLRMKGVLDFVEAAERVRLTHPRTRFQLLGAAGACNRTAVDAETVAGWQRAGLIEHLGTATDVRPAIAAADCVVLPSWREGAPRALLEAAAMARPVITTDVPGCRSVLDPGRTGLICAPRDPESLADACRELINLDPAMRRRMGDAGRRKMEAEFDESRIVTAYFEAIDTALGTRPDFPPRRVGTDGLTPIGACDIMMTQTGTSRGKRFSTKNSLPKVVVNNKTGREVA